MFDGPVEQGTLPGRSQSVPQGGGVEGGGLLGEDLLEESLVCGEAAGLE